MISYRRPQRKCCLCYTLLTKLWYFSLHTVTTPWVDEDFTDMSIPFTRVALYTTCSGRATESRRVVMTRLKSQLFCGSTWLELFFKYGKWLDLSHFEYLFESFHMTRPNCNIRWNLSHSGKGRLISVFEKSTLCTLLESLQWIPVLDSDSSTHIVMPSHSKVTCHAFICKYTQTG